MAFIETPPPPPAAAEVIVSRREANIIAASRDTPIILVKAGRREDAVMRRIIFAATEVTVARPADEADPAKDVYRWTHRAFIQRQLCVTSITGQFLCAVPESEVLGDGETGAAPVDAAAPAPFAEADGAAERLMARLRSRANGLFETDRKLRLEPMVNAAGAVVAPAAGVPREQRPGKAQPQGKP